MTYSPQTQWEYTDFVFTYPKNAMWARLGADAYSEATARIEFWQNKKTNKEDLK